MITAQTKTAEDYDHRLATLMSKHEAELKETYEGIEVLNKKTTKNASNAFKHLPENITDMLKSKPSGKSGKNINIYSYKCEFPGCN